MNESQIAINLARSTLENHKRLRHQMDPEEMLIMQREQDTWLVTRGALIVSIIALVLALACVLVAAWAVWGRS